jgi:hypothetical protein
VNAEVKPPAAVREMIEAAGIKRIVCVDDSYAVDVEDLIIQLSAFDRDDRATLFGEDLGPEGIWQTRVRERWKEDIGPEEQATLVDGAAALEQGLDPVLTGFAEIVTATCPEIDFLHFSLGDWKERKQETIDQTPTVPTLILFDQDFRNEGGAENEGQKLVADLERRIKDHEDVKLGTFYGILTNTVSVDEEHARRTEIVTDEELDAGRFVLISKQSMRDGAGLLPERLRPVLLSPLFAHLMEEVGAAVAAAQEEARKRAIGIPPEDLEQMVLQSSTQEGVWPPDTLLRILETMQRETVRKSLREEGGLLGVAERVEAVAKVVLPEPPPAGGDGKEKGESIEDEPAEDKPSERVPVAAEISNEEIYESAEHLNSLHLPIDLGDLFKNTETGDVYVLIAQPCNLMVREQGKRAYEPSHMLLAKVSAGTAADKTQFKLFELPYFDKETGESNFVRLNGPKVVRTLILDASVLNPDGRARLDLRSDEPVALLPHWKKRRGKLHRLADELLKQFEKLPEETQHETWVRDALGGSFRGDPFSLTSFSPEDKLIAWGCERIGRVRDPYARALLSRFSQYFARDAYLHDLAQQ